LTEGPFGKPLSNERAAVPLYQARIARRSAEKLADAAVQERYLAV